MDTTEQKNRRQADPAAAEAADRALKNLTREEAKDALQELAEGVAQQIGVGTRKALMGCYLKGCLIAWAAGSTFALLIAALLRWVLS